MIELNEFDQKEESWGKPIRHVNHDGSMSICLCCKHTNTANVSSERNALISCEIFSLVHILRCRPRKNFTVFDGWVKNVINTETIYFDWYHTRHWILKSNKKMKFD